MGNIEEHEIKYSIRLNTKILVDTNDKLTDDITFKKLLC